MQLIQKIITLTSIILLISSIQLWAQVEPQNEELKTMSKDEIMQMTYEELIELPFEDLIYIANKFELSADELLTYFLNKDVEIVSKTEESSFEAPLSSTVISAEDIEQSGATSIEELFRLMPGMVVRQKTNGNFDVHIRGNDNIPPGNFSHTSENMMTLVMLDNMVVYNYITGGTFWETFPVGLNDIERIEMVRGPASALYGPNAVSGVINIITKKPETSQLAVEAGGQYGNFNTAIGDVALTKGFGSKLKMRLGGTFETRDRFQDDFYSYIAQEYQHADSLYSLFGNPYFETRMGGKDPLLGKERLAFNGNFFFDMTDDVQLRLSGGWQKARTQTVFFETLATPFSIRKTQNNFVNFNAKIHDFTTQISYVSGVQDLSVGLARLVMKYDMETLNVLVEHNHSPLENLTIHPGVHYQRAVYDDTHWVKEVQQTEPNWYGLLNGRNELTDLGFYVRTDYTLFDRLRLIGAIRLDSYNYPDDEYFSYQMVGTYNFNDKHLLRAVYSRANRGAFMGDTYADYQNSLGQQAPQPTMIELPPGSGNFVPATAQINNYYQYYIGNQDLDLVTMDMYEIGVRNKLWGKVQTDWEFFYTKSQDYNALTALTAPFTSPQGINATFDTVYVVVHDSLHFSNLDVVSKQYGATASIRYYASEKLQFHFFGTYQHTELENYAIKPDSLIDTEHTWTPNFYGGMVCNYTPWPKININANTYFYTDQTYTRYQSPFGEKNYTDVAAKFILNLKVNYKFRPNSSIFLNARNLLNNKEKEFGFTDDIHGLYLIGISIAI